MIRSSLTRARCQYVVHESGRLVNAQYYTVPVRPITHALHFSTSTTAPSPSRSQPRRTSVLLPHEELNAKAGKSIQPSDSTQPPSQPAGLYGLNINLQHNNLSTYLTYHAHRLSLLSPNDTVKRHALNHSYVHLGTRYEYLIQSDLTSQLGFSLTRIGGKGDGGVDLIGTWSPPLSLPTPSSQTQSLPTPPKHSAPQPKFKVFIQAKRYAPHRKPSPSLMREVEGTVLNAADSQALTQAFAAHTIQTRDVSRQSPSSVSHPEQSDLDNSTPLPAINPHDTSLQPLGILVTTCPLGSGIEKVMSNSRQCLMYICIEEHPFDMPSSNAKLNLTSLDQDTAPETLDKAQANVETHTGRVSDPETYNQQMNIEREKLSVPCPSTKIRQIAWNAAAAQAGLEGYGVITKYDASTRDLGGEAVLAFQGFPVVLKRSTPG